MGGRGAGTVKKVRKQVVEIEARQKRANILIIEVPKD